MDARTQTKHSRFLSLVLRHQPEEVSLTLGDGGWIEVARLLEAMKAHGRALSRADLEVIVAGNDKQRFHLKTSSTIWTSTSTRSSPRCDPNSWVCRRAAAYRVRLLRRGV